MVLMSREVSSDVLVIGTLNLRTRDYSAIPIYDSPFTIYAIHDDYRNCLPPGVPRA